VEQRAEWTGRLETLAERAERQVERRALYGFHARDSYRPNDPEHPTVVLIHGLNSTSAVFRHMTPLLEDAGFGVLLYDYRDNQDLGRSAEEFVEDWKAFREIHEDRRPWAVVTHSMGGLLARFYVEGDAYQGDVNDLVMIAPPNGGAAVAKMQALLQFLRGIKAIDTGQAVALSAIEDGIGASADDLIPSSAFLKELNRHGRREGVEYHILAGDVGFLSREQRKTVEARIRTATKAGGLFGRVTRLALGDLRSPLDELTDGSGDGCVSLESSQLEGVDDYEVVHANHISLIRAPLMFPEPGPVAGMPFVLDRLEHLLPRGR
jgi:pimeloyl-ACP methyl ester carboxylesterase